MIYSNLAHPVGLDYIPDTSCSLDRQYFVCFFDFFLAQDRKWIIRRRVWRVQSCRVFWPPTIKNYLWISMPM